jgi:uncharacterized protein YegL
MPDLSTFAPAPRRDLHVFYVLDTSGSMSGLPIEQLNRAMEETVSALKQLAKHNDNANLKVAVLDFSSSADWMQPSGPEEVADFVWNDLKAGGLTSMGAALDELNDKLSRSKFLGSMTGALMPVVIFMTDGMATDDYQSALQRINQNKWFKKATKIGFAIGSDPDEGMIAEIVGNSEAVIRTDDLALFAKLIRFVSVTSSTLASRSQTVSTAVSGACVVSQVRADADPSYVPPSSTSTGDSQSGGGLGSGDSSATSSSSSIPQATTASPAGNDWDIDQW